jgi:hypothetical protein
MRKTLLLTLILLVCAAWAVAQQNSTPQTNPAASGSSQASQATSGQDVVEGCLGGSAGNFTLTDQAGASYQLQLPQGSDNAKLSQHIGQEVRVTGTMASAASSSAGQTPSSAGQAATSPSGSQTITVTKMDKISDTCSSSSGKSPSK